MAEKIGVSAASQPLTMQQALDLALKHHTAGELAQAESMYNQILQADPNQPQALHLLGVIAHQGGDNEKAVGLIAKALKIQPDNAEAHNNYGSALKELDNLDGAIASYQRALEINPDFAEVHYNMGLAFRGLGKLEDAIDCFQHAIALNPSYIEAFNNLGVTFQDLGRVEEAIASCKKAIELSPEHFGAHSNLGNALQQIGNVRDAVICYQKAITINPDNAEAHTNLGVVRHENGLLDEAVIHYRTALAIAPDNADIHMNIGSALSDLGSIEEGVSHYRKALEIKPGFVDAHSNLLLTEQYRPNQNLETLYKLHCEWDECHGRTFYKTWPNHMNNRSPDRILRVGFVSPKLGRHPVGFFVVGMFENWSEENIKIYVYSDHPGDDLTERIKSATDVWHNVRGISDEDLAKRILDDQIDILIDLSGHSAQNRLLMFARKPSPLQVSWGDYSATTGLSAIDYLICDKYSVRKNEEKYFTEKIILMPDCWLCYDPPTHAPKVGPLPFKRNGHITFGSFSNPVKLNDSVISVWSSILAGVPNSKIIIKYKGINAKSNIERLSGAFEVNGIDRSRLVLEGKSPHIQLLERYNDVDIALDPFPYSGGLTTLEALWMGVPVITLPGETFASRLSLSHLSNIGISELVARDQGDFVKLAIKLAEETEKLENLRATLRQTMANSAVCDSKKFAEGFAGLMREIWQNWCLQIS